MIDLQCLNVECKFFIVKYGNKCHLDQLVNDKDWSVRARVAIEGDMDHLEVLADDEDPWVRSFVKEL